MQQGAADIQIIIKATAFAAEKHTNQRRKNAEKSPYIEHPIGLALILSNEMGITDSDTLCAALLHDTIEDTDCTWAELEANFSPMCVKYVRQVTDDKSLPAAERKRLQIEHAPHALYGARLVKLADKLHNLRSFFTSLPVGWDWKRIQGYFVWSKAVTDAILETGFNMFQNALDQVYAKQFCWNGQLYDCIPKDVDLEEVLEEYYASL